MTPPTTHPPATTGADAAERTLSMLIDLLLNVDSEASAIAAHRPPDLHVCADISRLCRTLRPKVVGVQSELAAARSALAACRAACGLMREIIDVVAGADVQGESVGNQILIVKARNALAALADAERAGTEGG